MSLSLEIARFFILALPQTFFSLLAAFILLNEKIKGFWLKILFSSVLNSVFAILTFQFLTTNFFKNIIDLIFAVVIFKIVFKTNWFRAILITFIQYFGAIIFTLTAIKIAQYLYETPLDQLLLDKTLWLKVFLPIFILMPVPAYFLCSLGSLIHAFFLKIKWLTNIRIYTFLILAIALQLILLLLFAIYTITYNNYNSIYTVSFLSLALVALTAYILFKSMGIAEKHLVSQSQVPISDNIMGLINSVRSQRHDFVNNLQVINSLAYDDDKEELKKYLAKLTGSVSFYNKLLEVNEPVISALLNAKITQAEIKEIQVKLDVNADLAKLSTRAFDIARILGNLIDNALEAISNNQEEDRWIELKIEEKGPLLVFSVTNPEALPEEIAQEIFEPGFTTKDGSHSGLGIYICQQLAQKLHGKIDFTSKEEADTTFSLVFPKP